MTEPPHYIRPIGIIRTYYNDKVAHDYQYVFLMGLFDDAFYCEIELIVLFLTSGGVWGIDMDNRDILGSSLQS